MATREVAKQLVEMCREGKVEEAKREFFTEDTLSLEPTEGLLPKETKGLQAIKESRVVYIHG